MVESGVNRQREIETGLSQRTGQLRFVLLQGRDQGGKRLGDETSASEQKSVMQWTGIKLGTRSERLPAWVSSVILVIY